MTQFNGDKARFNRERKQNIQRRKRARAMLQAAATAGAGNPGKKPQGVPETSKERA